MMATSDRYATFLTSILELAKDIGKEQTDANAAETCYRILEKAIAQAEAWDVPLNEIGLANFAPASLLSAPAKAA